MCLFHSGGHYIKLSFVILLFWLSLRDFSLVFYMALGLNFFYFMLFGILRHIANPEQEA